MWPTWRHFWRTTGLPLKHNFHCKILLNFPAFQRALFKKIPCTLYSISEAASRELDLQNCLSMQPHIVCFFSCWAHKNTPSAFSLSNPSVLRNNTKRNCIFCCCLKFSLKLHFKANKFEMNLRLSFSIDHIMLQNILSLAYLIGSKQILSGWYSQFLCIFKATFGFHLEYLSSESIFTRQCLSN